MLFSLLTFAKGFYGKDLTEGSSKLQGFYQRFEKRGTGRVEGGYPDFRVMAQQWIEGQGMREVGRA